MFEKRQSVSGALLWAEAAGQGQQGDDRMGGMKTAKQLPLFLGVQAALVVLVLPTQEECDTLQPSQAKPSQASFVFSLLY